MAATCCAASVAVMPSRAACAGSRPQNPASQTRTPSPAAGVNAAFNLGLRRFERFLGCFMDFFYRLKQFFGPLKDFFGRLHKFFGSPKEIFGSFNKLPGTLNKFVGTPKDFFGSPKEFLGRLHKLLGSPKEIFGSLNKLPGTLKKFVGTLKEFFWRLKDFFGRLNKLPQPWRGLIWGLRKLFWSARIRPRFAVARHVSPGESGDASPQSKSSRRRFSASPAELPPGLVVLFDCACIDAGHPTKLISRAPCKHIGTSGTVPGAGRATAPSAHRTGLMTDRTPGRRARRFPARGRFAPFPPGTTSAAKLSRGWRIGWATTRAVRATGGRWPATPAWSVPGR